ncbi:hypothetical protein HDV00_004707 [Rhizophlyctis rosea]|nr:hypothetical protein HDV00_004707 [Rhizophlyctis rosea]
MTNFYDLPLEVLHNISACVVASNPDDDILIPLSQTCKGLRELLFSAPPGDTLKAFWTSGAIACALANPARLRHLRSLSLLFEPTMEILQLVFDKIDLSVLHTFQFKDMGSCHGNGDWDPLSALDAALAKTQKPLSFQTILIDSCSFSDPTSHGTFQSILDSLVTAPLREFTVETDCNATQQSHFNFNTVHTNLISVTLPGVVVIDDLATYVPNLQSLTIRNGLRYNPHVYPLSGLHLPSLSEIDWEGDGWAEELSQLPLPTLSNITSISITSFECNLNDCVLMLPIMLQLRSFCLRPYSLSDDYFETYPLLSTFEHLISRCPVLEEVDIVLQTYYTAKGLIDIIKSRPSLRVVSLMLADTPDVLDLATIRGATDAAVVIRLALDEYSVLEDPSGDDQ